mgnify:CR=1 FL=1
MPTFIDICRYPDDMDLFPAALSERHLMGGIAGPTFVCLIAKHVNHLKTGDRFLYENKYLSIGFQKGKLLISEIK